jgi:hypothetical protein
LKQINTERGKNMKKKTPKKTQKKKSSTVALPNTPPKQTKPTKWKFNKPADPGLTLRSDFTGIAILQSGDWGLVTPDGTIHLYNQVYRRSLFIRSLPNPEHVAAMCGNRWAWHHLSKFKGNQAAPTLSSIYLRIRRHLKAKIWLPDSSVSLTLIG